MTQRAFILTLQTKWFQGKHVCHLCGARVRTLLPHKCRIPPPFRSPPPLRSARPEALYEGWFVSAQWFLGPKISKLREDLRSGAAGATGSQCIFQEGNLWKRWQFPISLYRRVSRFWGFRQQWRISLFIPCSHEKAFAHMSGLIPANQTKERSVHELFAAANLNQNSMWIVLVFKTVLGQASTWKRFWRDFLEIWGVTKQTFASEGLRMEISTPRLLLRRPTSGNFGPNFPELPKSPSRSFSSREAG